MNKLSDFSLPKYIEYLEDRFDLYDNLNNLKNYIQTKLITTNNKALSYDFCVQVKRMIKKRLDVFQKKYSIETMTVSFIASGIFRVYIGICSLDNNPEFLTINIQ